MGWSNKKEILQDVTSTLGLDFDNEDIEEEASSNHQTTSSVDKTEWKQFLKDYEEWVDDYITLMEKSKANPSDISIMSDYAEMLSEMAEWAERADEIELELEDTNEALEYSAELLRIAEKLAEAAY